MQTMQNLKKPKRFKSFDDMLAEKQSDTVTIRVYGKNYVIPARIPAIVPVMLARHEGEPTKLEKMTWLACDMVFGTDTIDEWTRHPGFTRQHLETILMDTFRLIYGVPEAEPEEQIEDDDEKAAGDKVPK